MCAGVGGSAGSDRCGIFNNDPGMLKSLHGAGHIHSHTTAERLFSTTDFRLHQDSSSFYQHPGSSIGLQSSPQVFREHLLDRPHCEICGQVFKSREGYTRHKRKHQDYSQFRYTCHLCLKKFYRRDHLSSHLRHKHKLGRA